MDESMCSVDDHAIMSHEVQPYIGSCQIAPYDKMFCKGMVFNIKVYVAFAIGFSNRPFATCIWKSGGFVDFEDTGWGLLFDFVHFFSSYCTNIGSWVNEGIYCQAILEIQRDIHISFFRLRTILEDSGM